MSREKDRPNGGKHGYAEQISHHGAQKVNAMFRDPDVKVTGVVKRTDRDLRSGR